MSFRPNPRPAQWKKDYRRGWAASERGSVTALERADMRHESTAWYDGYYDCAVGREKGALLKFDTVEEWEAVN